MSSLKYHAPWSAAPVQLAAEQITFPCSDGFSMAAYLSRPDSASPVRGIVFAFTAAGLTLEMKRIADDVAALGYAVIVPDLYARGVNMLCLARLFSALPSGRGRGVDDLIAAGTWLATRPFLQPARLVAMGFYIQGDLSLLVRSVL